MCLQESNLSIPKCVPNSLRRVIEQAIVSKRIFRPTFSNAVADLQAKTKSDRNGTQVRFTNP